MIEKSEAEKALRSLLWELPAEFSSAPDGHARGQFHVVKPRNVLKVHNSLWTLQKYFEGHGETQ